MKSPLSSPAAPRGPGHAAAALMDQARRAMQSGDAHAIESSFAGLVALIPNDAKLHFNHARALAALGRVKEAEQALRRALALDPDLPQANTNLGNLLTRDGRLDEAETLLRRAVTLQPTAWRTHYNLATLLQRGGQLDEARTVVDRALALDRDAVEAHQLRLQLEFYTGKASDEQLYDFHRQTAAAIARQNGPPVSGLANDPDPERRLRVGYVSPDLRAHSVANFAESILRAHDRQAVELFCYSDVEKPDDITQRIRGAVDHWRDTRPWNNERLTRQVLADRIDVLVDLAGHTRDNRLGVFVRKPAPVQATWIGHVSTTGLEAIDIRFTDAVADPPGVSERFHSEVLVRLEPTFLCYFPPPEAPEPGDCPALRGEAPVFGSFNNIAKLSMQTIEAWAGVLQAVPESTLVLKSSGVANRASFERFFDMLAARGVARERIEFLPYAPSRADHLALYGRMDVALDTFPFNGATTTAEALYMAVPVVGMDGPAGRHVARVAQSLLQVVGLGDLVGADRADFVAKAAALIRDRNRVGQLRRGLRGQVLASPLCDAPALARQVEATYRQYWRAWCAGQREGKSP